MTARSLPVRQKSPAYMPARLLWLAVLQATVLAMALPVVAADSAWKLTQRHYFLGRWTTLIDKTGLKVENMVDGYSIVTKPPSWKVVFYNDKTHRAYETTLKRWMKTGLMQAAGYVTEASIKAGNPQASAYLRIPATKYTFRRLDLLPSNAAFARSNLPKESPVVVSNYWTTARLTDHVEIAHFLQRLFTLPECDELPLAFVDSMADKTKNAVMDTLDCKSVAPLSLNIAYPVNYKICKEQRDITISSSKQSDIDDWASSLGH